MNPSFNESVEKTKDYAADAAQAAKNNVTDAANRTLSDAKDKVSHLRGRMETVGSHIDDIACKASKEASEIANTVSHKLSGAAGSVTDEIRKYPVQAAAIALAVGIVGTLFYKRSA